MARKHARLALALLLGLAALPAPRGAAAQEGAVPPAHDYLLFVASEGNDRVALVRFGAAGARVEREQRVGTNPTEPQGPHGLGVDRERGVYYVASAHGTPGGFLWKFDAATGRQLGRTQLGRFPATTQVAPGGEWVWVANFNLHGPMAPSSVSAVWAPEMIEVARIPTCAMPHGSRLSPDGRRHFSACMMDDLLIEIDAERLEVSRHFVLAPGLEQGGAGLPGSGGAAHHAGAGAAAAACSPTWAQPSADGRTVWATCSRSDELVEIAAETWTLRRRLPAGEGVYNLAVTGDGRLLVATNRRGQSVSVFDAVSGRELARLPTLRRLPSGVAISPDDRYAFVTVEGSGAEPGTVEVFDLAALVRVASVDVGQQAGGIDFWRVEAAVPAP